MNYKIDEDFQVLLINSLLSDAESFSRCRNIIKDEYFTSDLKPVVRYILDYAETYGSLPIPEQIGAAVTSKHRFSLLTDPQPRKGWLIAEIERFCRYRAIENVILNGTDLLNKGAHAEIERQIKDAMTISLITDLGSDYFSTAKERIDRLKNRSNIVTSGWSAIDKRLYGGYAKGSLNIFAGQSGSGKSLFLQNNALNWANAGMNVIYITLELSEDLVGNRIDSMVTGKSTKEVFRNSNEVCLEIERYRMQQRPGSLRLKKMPEAGTNCNDIRAYLKEYQIKTGLRPDGLLIDYLDLVYPNNTKIDIANAFVKDKQVSEEMRSIGGDWDIPVVSASQLNRGSIEAQEFDHSHIAGGISKINTADNVFGIFTTKSMRESGRYQLQFLKTRSSAAVGSNCDLAYDPATMRITDPIGEEDTEDEVSTLSRPAVPQFVGGPNSSSQNPSVKTRTELDVLFTKLRR